MLLEESKQDEAPLLSVEGDVSNNESAQFTDLSFPWPLINAIKRFYVLFQSKSKLTKEFRFFLRSELIVVITCIIFIIYGSIGHQDCNGYSMACKALIVQGACGLFVALSYVSSLLFE